MSEFEKDPENLRWLLRALPEMVLVVDRGGRIQYLNRAEPGYDAEDLVGLKAEDLTPAASQERFHRALEALVATGEEQEYEAEVRLEDGFQAWYQIRMLPLGGEDEVTSVLLLATNITELKAAREDAARLRRILSICSWCDRIRHRDGRWEPIEDYLQREEEAGVSHGICPDCSERLTDGGAGGGKGNGNVA